MKKILVLVAFLVMTFGLIFSSPSPVYANPNLDLGIEKYNAKDYSSALTYLNTAIKENCRLSKAYYYRGSSYIELKEYDEAIKDFTKEITLEPKNYEGYYGRGAAYAAKQEYDKALPDLNKAVELAPQKYEIYLARAMTLYELKNKTDAMHDIDKAIEIAPKEPTPYGIKALFELADGNFGAAFSDFRKSKKYSKLKDKAKK